MNASRSHGRRALLLAAALVVVLPQQLQAADPLTAIPGVKDLDVAERKLFDKVVGGELCPCGKAMSLKKCLKREDVCERAVRVASVVVDRVRDGLSYSEVVDGMIRYLEMASKKHSFDLKDRPFKGNAKAGVVLVEFSDFQCPYCSKARGILGRVLAAYPNQVKVVYKHFPLPFHAHAGNAALAAELGRRRGRFWQVHDALFDSQDQISEAHIMALLKRAGIDPDKVPPAEWDAARKLVEADFADGQKAGVEGTPTIFLNGIELPAEDFDPDALVRRVGELLGKRR